MSLMVLRAMLKKVGDFDVAMAADGRKALDALEAAGDKPFDIVLTDMWMPEMDGEGLVRAIRADPRLARLPVHVVTADVEMRRRHAEIGFTSILLKPVTVGALAGVLGGSAERKA
jgi:CheY-like chemotaxis protein